MILRGSVINDSVKHDAVDLVANTIGVTTVVDELAVVKEVKVIKGKPDVRIIGVTPPASTETQVVFPSNSKVIVKP